MSGICGVLILVIVIAALASSSSDTRSDNAEQSDFERAQEAQEGVVPITMDPITGFSESEEAYLAGLHQGITDIGPLDDSSLVTLGYRGCQGLDDDHDIMTVQRDLYAIMRPRNYGTNDVGRVMDEAIQNLCPEYSHLLDGTSTDPSPETPAQTAPPPAQVIDRSYVESQVADDLQRTNPDQGPFDVSCPDDLDDRVGATLECTLTNATDGLDYPVSIRVTAVDADGYADFSYQVGDPLLPGE